MRLVTQQINKTTEELGGDAAKTFPSLGGEKEFSETKLQNPMAQRKDTGLWHYQKLPGESHTDTTPSATVAFPGGRQGSLFFQR